MRRGLAGHIVGIGRRPEALAAAQRLGAVHSTSIELEQGVAGAELIVVCTPVGSIVAQVIASAGSSAPGTLITDAGSTKAEIVRQIESQLHDGRRWRNDVHFLGGHPIAGNDRKGAQHARADLFEGRATILTPTANTAAADRRTLRDFWTALGARVVEMEPDAHDQALAAISHAPHVVAAAVAAGNGSGIGLAGGRWLVGHDPGGGGRSGALAANPAQPTASTSSPPWIVLSEKLAALRQAIADRDAAGLEKLLAEAKQVRDAVGS